MSRYQRKHQWSTVLERSVRPYDLTRRRFVHRLKLDCGHEVVCKTRDSLRQRVECKQCAEVPA